MILDLEDISFQMKQFFFELAQECICFHVENVMQESISMSMTQSFEVERMNRAIESTADPVQLQTLAKQLLHAWQSQRAATQWVIRQHQDS